MNGTNSAKNSTVTFGQAGGYEFLVTISNGFLSTTSSVSVNVDQTLRSLNIAPAQSPLALNAPDQIQATGYDQFGQVMQTLPALTWSVAPGQGSVDPSGLYTAPGVEGDYAIRASYGAVLGGTIVQVRNTAPKITQGPTGTIDSSGKTAQFQVLATDDGGAANLVYTWSTVNKPSGAADPIFSDNGDNAAKDAVATFGQTGVYLFDLTVSDGSLSADKQFTVTVDPVLGSIQVTPGNATVASGSTQQFTASAADQFGQPFANASAFSWSVVGGGSVTSDGLYTAFGGGNATVKASAGGTTGQASVTILNNAPTVAQAATAVPQTGTSTTTHLSVLGADDGGESHLTYTWTVTNKPAGAPNPTFSANGTNASKDTIATYAQAGSYTFLVTIFDGDLSTTSSVTTSVTQKVTSVTVSPANVTVSNGQTQQFSATALDQFGKTMATQPPVTWSLQSSGAVSGTISTTGLYTAPASGAAQDKVIASATGPLSEIVQGSGTVTVNGSVAQSIFTGEADVGSPATAGSSTFANGTYTVSGGGNQIWDPVDQFHYVYKSITGDATIVARVASVQKTHWPRRRA